MTIEKIADIDTLLIPLAEKVTDDSDWEQINQEIETLKNLPDHNIVAAELLKYANHDNPDVRDTVASALYVLEISDSNVLETCLNSMILQATKSDEQIYAAGRAAAFLNKFSNRSDVQTALFNFKLLYQDPSIRSDLIENISSLQSLFTKS